MSLQFKFFAIPITDPESAEEEMNRFLRTVKVVTIHREFLPSGENSRWLLSVEYQTGHAESQPRKTTEIEKEKIDYKEVLSSEDFAIYARLRDWRKETGEKEGVQLYTIFTNKQMATIVQNKIRTKEALKELSGVGDAKVQKYGDAVISIMKEETAKLEKMTDGKPSDETSEKPVLLHTDPGKSEGGLPQGGQGQTAQKRGH